jgi:2-octaprenyl-6-methoxyphenol hydroxylase
VSTPAAPGPDCDVAIVGGGMVGASLALALGALPLEVACIEAVASAAEQQPSFDARTTALSNGSRRILAALGAWDEIGAAATPIRRIHVSERGVFGSAMIDAAEQGLEALGYVAENRLIGRALGRALARTARVRTLAPAAVTATRECAAGIELELAAPAGPSTLRARLVVAADGAGSLVRREAGIATAERDYHQSAVIATLAPQRFHEHVAYERFTSAGPIALLPAAGGRMGVVWTLAPEAAARALALAPADFLAELQRAFGWRVGRLAGLGARRAYPLALTRAESQRAPRVAVVGNAAQGLHPVAGQGFNLGLRDAATLAEAIAERPAGGDPGSDEVLLRYVESRRSDRRALIAFTDGLVRLFGLPLAPLAAARGLGLLAFDLSPPAKTALSRLSLGFAERMPRLERGLPVPGRPPAAAP